jgi:hypothetical protein
MNKEQLADYVAHGREIEFKYNGKMYSITYSPVGMEDFISFCEFYQEPIDVKTVDELIKVTWDGVTVLQMLESLSEQDIWIY